MSTPSSRKPRADAERNRARILAAARALFTERGADVQSPEVARAAGVGVGTVYRHFPTREDLIEAAAQQRFAEIEEFARTVCPHRTNGVAAYLYHVGEVLSADRGLSSAIESARRSSGSEPRGAARTRLEATIDQLIEQGQAEGTLRDDCTVADVYLVAGALSATIRTGNGDWRRLIDITLSGLRPR